MSVLVEFVAFCMTTILFSYHEVHEMNKCFLFKKLVCRLSIGVYPSETWILLKDLGVIIEKHQYLH